jgi:hypothetical protein
MKTLSSVLLPRWEEDVEEGEHSPSPQSSPSEGRGRLRFVTFIGGKRGI